MNCNHPIWSPVCSFHYNGECLRDHNYECPALMENERNDQMTPEKHVQNAIIDYLVKLENLGLPIFHERRQAGGYSYKMGQADLYFVYDGQHVEIEVKAPGKSLNPMQIKWQTKCRSLGITCEYFDDVEKFKNWFNATFNPEF